MGAIFGKLISVKPLNWLEPLHKRLQDRLWLTPSCSLLHVPVDLDSEQHLDPEVQSWLAFAIQKLSEVSTLTRALNEGRGTVADKLAENVAAIASKKQSARVHTADVKKPIIELTSDMAKRHSFYTARATVQRKKLNLPSYASISNKNFCNMNLSR